MKVTLKALRANKGYTQQQAAKSIGVTADTWRKWENGLTFPDVPKIDKIEKEFGVKYDDIIFLVGITVKPYKSKQSA